MRQIKFREFLPDGRPSQFHYWGLVDGNFIGPSNFKNKQDQFTGLLDKNGKEIYYQDFVESDSGDIMLVVWIDRLASFALRKKGWAFDHYFGEAVEYSQVKVVGNLHQNPELL